MRYPLTICKNCKFFLEMELGSRSQGKWYNLLCKASPITKTISPVTGDLQPDQDYKFCRDVNKGDCDLYERKDDENIYNS